MQNSTSSTSSASQIQLPSFEQKLKTADPEGWCCLVIILDLQYEFVKMQKLSGIMLVTSLLSAKRRNSGLAYSLWAIGQNLRGHPHGIFIDVF